MSLTIKTGFNDLEKTPELMNMAATTRCCSTGTCVNKPPPHDLKSNSTMSAERGNTAQAMFAALKL